jgi:phage terminase large subunit-like protein
MTHAEYRASLKGRPCYVGLDLASTTDLTALVGVLPDGAGNFDVVPEFFVPADRIADRARRDRVPYDEWARRGLLVATPGNIIDYEYIRVTLHRWAADFDIKTIGFDPWNATDLITRLQEQDGFTCVEVRQGFASLSAPSKALEAAILSKRLRHNGHPVLRWCIGNVALEMDAAGNIKPSKKASTERIDGVIALVVAIDQMDRHQHAAQAPGYSMMVFGG